MRPLALLLLAASSALAAPLFQEQVEALRAGGMSEKDILNTLHANHPTPAYTGYPLYSESTTSTVYDFIDRDTSGDISPGSLPSFHYTSDARLMARIRKWVAGCDGWGGERDGGDDEGEGLPKWRFAWMGGGWKSAASRVPRMR